MFSYVFICFTCFHHVLVNDYVMSSTFVLLDLLFMVVFYVHCHYYLHVCALYNALYIYEIISLEFLFYYMLYFGVSFNNVLFIHCVCFTVYIYCSFCNTLYIYKLINFDCLATNVFYCGASVQHCFIPSLGPISSCRHIMLVFYQFGFYIRDL